MATASVLTTAATTATATIAGGGMEPETLANEFADASIGPGGGGGGGGGGGNGERFGATAVRAGDASRPNDRVATREPGEVVRGTVFRKRKYRDNVSLAVRRPFAPEAAEPRPPVLVMVPKSHPSMRGCFLGTVVEVELEPTPSPTPTPTPSPSEGGATTTAIHTTKATDGSDSIHGPDPERRRSEQPRSKGAKQHAHRSVRCLRILRSSPDPNAIQVCLKLVAEGRLPVSVFSGPGESTDATDSPLRTAVDEADATAAILPTSGRPLLGDVDRAREILSLGPKDPVRKALVKRLSCGLKGEPIDDDGNGGGGGDGGASITVRPRKRLTFVKRRHRRVLEKLEASQSPIDPIRPFPKKKPEDGETGATTSRGANGATAAGTAEDGAPVPAGTSASASGQSPEPPGSDAAVYNLPDPSDPAMKSGRHPKTRREYLRDKKWPQIRWLVRRLAPIAERLRAEQQQQQQRAQCREPSRRRLEVLDIGGGRGDLAVAVAEAFPDARVTVVDLNESSLKGGRAYYRSRKPPDEEEDRVVFVCGDFADYGGKAFRKAPETTTSSSTTVAAAAAAGTPQKRFDVVIAWHACGDLSDYALEFAVQTMAGAFVVCPCCYTKRNVESAPSSVFRPKWVGDYLAQRRRQQQRCVPVPTDDDDDKTGDDRSNNADDGDIRTVQRLAEINERPEITHRAMGLINTMRLRSLVALSSSSSAAAADDATSQQQQQQQPPQQPAHPQDPGYAISLEKYDLSYSSKNLVLVGIRTTREHSTDRGRDKP